MRGENVRPLFAALLLILVLMMLASCAPTPKAEPKTGPRTGNREADGRVEKDKPKPDDPGKPKRESMEPWPHSPFKGAGTDDREVPDRRGTRPAPRPDDEVVDLQKRRVEMNPLDDAERIKLAILYALNQDYIAALDVLEGLRHRTHPLIPFVEAFVYRKLGEHQKAKERIESIIREIMGIEGLKMERVELCTRIEGYRRYELNKVARVHPGGIALLYLEPRNYALREEEGLWKLDLRYDWRLFNDRGQEIVVPLWQSARPTDREDHITFSGPVREFYQSFRLPLPSNLAAGGYRIEVSVVDLNQGSRKDVRFVPFEVPAVMGK